MKQLIWFLAALGLARGQDMNSFVADVLKGHGEKGVIIDAQGVHIKGITFVTRLTDTQKTRQGVMCEVDFNIALADGRSIQEQVVGVGKSQPQACSQAAENFLTTTFHPVYRCLINPKDPHQAVLKWGNLPVAPGTAIIMGSSAPDSELKKIDPILEAAVRKLRMKPGVCHWVKIVVALDHGQAIQSYLFLDNQEQPSQLARAGWPKITGMAKQFFFFPAK